jgi:hypothetical protein
MTKLDPTLKHLGTVLRRRLSDPRVPETPSRIAELLERLGQGDRGRNDTPSAAPSPK